VNEPSAEDSKRPEIKGKSVRIENAAAADAPAIRALHLAAFQTHAEADLVEQATAHNADLISIVARPTPNAPGPNVVGHLLVTPVTIQPTNNKPWTACAIGPIAVLPNTQRTGVGTALMHDAINRCRAQSHPAIILLGDPAYYTRFAFTPAHNLGYTCKWNEAGDAFMALQLKPTNTPGHVKYHEIFNVF
jgi:putative acetyltransferase